jgi:hypothetical protein
MGEVPLKRTSEVGPKSEKRLRNKEAEGLPGDHDPAFSDHEGV